MRLERRDPCPEDESPIAPALRRLREELSPLPLAEQARALALVIAVLAEEMSRFERRLARDEGWSCEPRDFRSMTIAPALLDGRAPEIELYERQLVRALGLYEASLENLVKTPLGLYERILSRLVIAVLLAVGEPLGDRRQEVIDRALLACYGEERDPEHQPLEASGLAEAFAEAVGELPEDERPGLWPSQPTRSALERQFIAALLDQGAS